jgi:regulator of sigma E protease
MSWVYVFLGFSALIILHEAGHFFAAKATGMRVERFFLFFGPKLVSVKRGETEYGIATIPAGGYVKISGMNPDDKLPPGEEHRGYYEQPVWKRIVVIGAGPAVNIALAFVILFFVFFLSGRQVTQTVGEIESGTPAARTLQSGDRIVAVDGRSFKGVDESERLESFRRRISSHKCGGKPVDGCLATTPVTLRVMREGRPLTISVKPAYDASLGYNRLGFSYGTEAADLSAGESLRQGLDAMWRVTSGTVTVFANILDPERRKEVSGVVGVSDVGHQVIEKFGAAEAFFLLAVVSLSLGLINLFPFLPLDGGHIFWSLAEKVRRRPIPFSVMEKASVIGVLLVLMIFFVGLSNDIGRLTGEGFNVR